MRNKESWFSVAIHPAFLIEDELEKSKRSAAAKAAAASLQIGFPELDSKPPSVSPQTPSADLDEQRRGLIETLQAPARQVIRTIENRPPAAPEAPEPEAPEPEAPAPQSRAERAAAAQARIRQGYLARTATQARIDALTKPESDPVAPVDIPAHARTERTFGRINVSDPVVPEIHPDDKIWPTGDSPSLVDRIGGHLQNLKDRLSRIFGSSPEAPASKPPASEASEPVAPAERDASAQAQIRDGSQARREGDPDSQALVQNLIEQPVGQVDNPDPESVSTQTPSTGRPLSEIRTLGDAKAHSEKLNAMYIAADAAHKANPSDDTEAAYWKAFKESIAADKVLNGYQDFEDAHTTDLLHGRDAISTLRKDNEYHPVSGKHIGDYEQELLRMSDAMQQRIEDAGGIHEAMKNPELAPKIHLVHEAWEHMRETFPDRHAAMESDEHDGDVLERPLEGIRNSKDAWNHSNEVVKVFQDESHKFDAMADGSPEKKAQRLLLDKADETNRRAGAHFNALSAYRNNHLDMFGSHLDGLDPENMSEEDRETYRIHMNAVNTVLKQKIEAAGGKDYAQYYPRIKAFQDRIRQIAEAHQAANPEAWEKARRESAARQSATPWALAPYYGNKDMWDTDQLRDQNKRGRTWPAGQEPSNQFNRVEASNQDMLRQREASAQAFEAKRQAEIAKEQERQRNLRSITDTLGVKYGSPKRKR